MFSYWFTPARILFGGNDRLPWWLIYLLACGMIGGIIPTLISIAHGQLPQAPPGRMSQAPNQPSQERAKAYEQAKAKSVSNKEANRLNKKSNSSSRSSKKQCQCSPVCTCGCNEGYPCQCHGTRATDKPYNLEVQPRYQANEVSGSWRTGSDKWGGRSYFNNPPVQPQPQYQQQYYQPQYQPQPYWQYNPNVYQPDVGSSRGRSFGRRGGSC